MPEQSIARLRDKLSTEWHDCPAEVLDCCPTPLLERARAVEGLFTRLHLSDMVRVSKPELMYTPVATFPMHETASIIDHIIEVKRDGDAMMA